MAACPNILSISTHDLGRRLGVHGHDWIQSPNLDALAGAGVRFNNSFCSAPQCSPSRASLYTGCYPHRLGVLGLTHDPFGWDLQCPERHLANQLAQAGYQTSLFGIQHEARDSKQLGFREVDWMIQPADVVAEKAAAGLGRLAAAAKPFYMQVGFFEPHRPFEFGREAFQADPEVHVPEFLVDQEDTRAELREFKEAIYRLDVGVGRLLGRLRELGLWENTLVLFHADHGIAFPRAKCSLFDPGLEAAFIMHWPDGGITGGRALDTLTTNVDVVPTVLDLLGIEADPDLDGISLAPELRGEPPANPREHIFGELTYHDYYDPRRCIRSTRHKLIANFSSAYFYMDPAQQWVRTSRPIHPEMPEIAYHPDLEFYDLKADPLECRNLFEGDGALPAECGEMMRRLHQWMEATGDPLLKPGGMTSPQHERVLARLRTEA